MGLPDLSISIERTADQAVMTLVGEIDMSTVMRLSKAVEDVLHPAPSRVVLDMREVTFCDSQGLGTLVVLSRRVTMAQSYLLLINVGDFLMRVLDITGLRGALMIQDGATQT